MLQIEQLTTGHDGIPAVRGLDLTVESGEVVALLGANGAGKTTTLRTISGLLRPMAGTIRFAGQDLSRLSPRCAPGSASPTSPKDAGCSSA